MENIISFLKELSQNNNREWFTANKKDFKNVQGEFEQLVSRLISAIAEFDKSIGPLEPKECIFRIYRDVRFSHDKRPYKTNFGAFFVQGGRKSPFAGYYLHIEPGASFAGGGSWMPAPDFLKAIRQEIFYNTGEFKDILEKPEFKKFYNGISDYDDKLKKAPKDFPADFPDIELLKHKHYTVGYKLLDSDVLSPGFFDHVVQAFKAMQPLCRFLNKAMD